MVLVLNRSKFTFVANEQTPHTYPDFFNGDGHFSGCNLSGVLALQKLPGREAESSYPDQFPFPGGRIPVPGKKNEAGHVNKVQVYFYR